MEILRAKILGFCAGVRRAVVAADKALSENKTGHVYTLGPLIHNPQALESLAERNLKILTENEIPSLNNNDTVIIRAHGVPPETDAAIRSKGVNVINATCPLVTKSQKTAAEYAEKGYIIFFAGDKNHGEVIGIEGYARQAALNAGKKLNFILIKDVEELKKEIELLQKNNILTEDSKIILLSQTTFSIKMFELLKNELKNLYPHSEITSSICPATHERQDSLTELCSKVDGVIVIGGKTSANTNRLFKTAEKLCKKAVLIETPDEIPEEFYSIKKIGITAGASTPDDIILETEKKLIENSKL
ncbi:4-hydroxy-3-methylbut-2-enyl diphosphate reductase [Treponema sp.]|uniref:4-hydroxy-3-methylbut-2-enyl diphosphate reductase n=1 Tax=Treponema sp. TaxID=166 RepID=UPI0038901977